MLPEPLYSNPPCLLCGRLGGGAPAEPADAHADTGEEGGSTRHALEGIARRTRAVKRFLAPSRCADRGARPVRQSEDPSLYTHPISSLHICITRMQATLV